MHVLLARGAPPAAEAAAATLARFLAEARARRRAGRAPGAPTLEDVFVALLLGERLEREERAAVSALGAASRAASLRRTLAIARKEFRQLARDRLTLGMIVGIPSLQLVLFGYAINLDVRHVPTAVLDRAQSALSRRLVGELEATQTFRLARGVTRRARGDPAARAERGRAR